MHGGKQSSTNVEELLRVYSYSGGKLNHLINLEADEGHERSVKDVAWAPQNGREYHTIGK